MMMPASAMTPRIATKPKGAWNTSNVVAAPITPSGPVASTTRVLPKCWSWTISNRRMTKSMTGIFSLIDVRRLDAVGHHTADGNGWKSVSPPLDPGLKHDPEGGHLAQRHGCTVGGLHINIVERGKQIARVRRLAQHHFDGLVFVTKLANLETRQHRLQ